jgi:hypothetical protein
MLDVRPTARLKRFSNEIEALMPDGIPRLISFRHCSRSPVLGIGLSTTSRYQCASASSPLGREAPTHVQGQSSHGNIFGLIWITCG